MSPDPQEDAIDQIVEVWRRLRALGLTPVQINHAIEPLVSLVRIRLGLPLVKS